MKATLFALACAALAGCETLFGGTPPTDTAAAACHAKGDFIAAMHHNLCTPEYAAQMEALVATDPDCKIAFGGKKIRVRCPGADAGATVPPDAQAPSPGATDAMEAQ